MGTQSFSYYSDGFLMQVFSQIKAQVQPPLHNKGSLGFSPPFYSLSFEKEQERERKKEGDTNRESTLHLPAYCEGLENQSQFLLYTAPKRKSFSTSSPHSGLEAALLLFQAGPWTLTIGKLRMALLWVLEGAWVSLNPSRELHPNIMETKFGFICCFLFAIHFNVYNLHHQVNEQQSLSKQESSYLET